MRIVITVLLCALTVISLPTTSFAQDTTTDETAAERIRQQLQETIDTRCQITEDRITLRITRYENNYSRHNRVYTQMLDKLESLIERAEAAGYDTTQLAADVVVWEGKIDLFRDAYADYIAALRATQAYACGQSEGAFKEAWRTARAELTTVQQASLDARLYYQQTIRATLEELKTQKDDSEE